MPVSWSHASEAHLDATCGNEWLDTPSASNEGHAFDASELRRRLEGQSSWLVMPQKAQQAPRSTELPGNYVRVGVLVGGLLLVVT